MTYSKGHPPRGNASPQAVGLTLIPDIGGRTTYRVNPPVGSRYVPIDADGSEELKHLTMRRADMATTKVTCAAYLAYPDSSDDTIPEALWRTALISYGRAFSSDRRKLGKFDLGILDDDLRKIHDYLIALRNRFVAHSVVGYETVLVAAELREHAGQPYLVGVRSRHLIGADLDKRDIEMMMQLAELFDAWARSRAQELMNRIHEQVKAMDIRALHALPDLTYSMPNMTDLQK